MFSYEVKEVLERCQNGQPARAGRRRVSNSGWNCPEFSVSTRYFLWGPQAYGIARSLSVNRYQNGPSWNQRK